MTTHGRPQSRQRLVFGFAAISCLWLAAALPATTQDTPHKAPELWFYYPVNLQVDANIATLEPIWRRAAKAGYSKVLLTDSKFGRLGSVIPRYFENAARVKALARELDLEIVPAVFPMGWSDALLANDPNLVEALPVRDALFEVRNGEARPVTDPATAFRDGGFDDLTKWEWHDPCVGPDNGTAHVTGAQGQNARIGQHVTVKPFHQYHVSVRVRTQNYTATPVMIQVLADGSGLSLNDADLQPRVQPTQEWTLHHAVFNSLDCTQVYIAFRAGWTGAAGDLWWDDARIEDAGLLNLVRRDALPLSVTAGADGRELTEGKDFEKIRDPKMGNVPWPGGYDVWHEPPVLRTPQLPDGTRLRLAFHHAFTTDAGKVMICPSEEKTIELLRDQARRLHALWQAKAYFMCHDEIRILNQDLSCRRRQLTAGEILADNVRVCTAILNDVNPGGRVYVWSDMFDPSHNAVQRYYLVRGSLAGSWKGLAPATVIANWNFCKRDASLAFFADRGHRQLIAGYYDVPREQLSEATRAWLSSAAKVNGVEAFMYTTWANRYDDLERVAEIVRAFAPRR